MSRLGYHRGYNVQGLVLRNADVFTFLLPPIMLLGVAKKMAVGVSLLLVLLVCWGGHWTHGQSSKIHCTILSSLADNCTCI